MSLHAPIALLRDLPELAERLIRGSLVSGADSERTVSIGLAGVAYIVAVILFILAAVPPTEPYRGRLMCVGLAFFAAAFLVP